MSDLAYTIGVVTYHARFDQYFKPLIERLARIFPDVAVVAILNGHPDQTLQLKYLKEATDFLRRFNNVKYIAHTDHQSLSRCWNQVVILSNTENILILNDDTNVSELFRSEFEPHVGENLVTTINRSWSHFLINKDAIRKVGWFDERFLGVGHEDGDYAYRMTMAGIKLSNLACDGVRNFVAKNTDPGWQAISKTSSGNKYAEVNREFFYKKWRTPVNSEPGQHFDHISDFGGGQFPFSANPGMETPSFYDLAILTSKNNKRTRVSSRHSFVKMTIEKLYFMAGRRLARMLRRALAL